MFQISSKFANLDSDDSKVIRVDPRSEPGDNSKRLEVPTTEYIQAPWLPWLRHAAPHLGSGPNGPKGPKGPKQRPSQGRHF